LFPAVCAGPRALGVAGSSCNTKTPAVGIKLLPTTTVAPRRLVSRETTHFEQQLEGPSAHFLLHFLRCNPPSAIYILHHHAHNAHTLPSDPTHYTSRLYLATQFCTSCRSEPAAAPKSLPITKEQIGEGCHCQREEREQAACPLIPELVVHLDPE